MSGLCVLFENEVMKEVCLRIADIIIILSLSADDYDSAEEPVVRH